MPLSPEAVRWFRDRRGITAETLGAFGVYTEGRDLVFPYPANLLKRRYSVEQTNAFGLEKDGRRFVWKDGSGGPAQAGQVPFLPPGFEPRERMVLVEGETDAMAAWQNLPDDLRDKVGIVGISGVGSWDAIEEVWAEKLFGSAKRVFVVFDRDDPYTNADGAASVERAWGKIRAALGRKARRVVLPQGIEDVAEFFLSYDWAAFQVLLQKAAEPKRNYPRLDLTKPVPDTDWLVEDLLVRSEATAIVADGGAGKSWLMMALALSVAGGKDTFLGRPVKRHGAVLYVDEENSRDLIMQRLDALAMGLYGKPLRELPDVLRNLEYVWYAGVDLLNEPEKLLEEAQEVSPELVVVDSLSRVAVGAKSENDNAEMGRLMRQGAIPIARDTGAALAIVHHTAQGGTGPRGATAIRNAADQVISVVPAMSGEIRTGRLNIFASKPRRKTEDLQAEIVGDMEADGVVHVKAVHEEMPF